MILSLKKRRDVVSLWVALEIVLIVEVGAWNCLIVMETSLEYISANKKYPSYGVHVRLLGYTIVALPDDESESDLSHIPGRPETVYTVSLSMSISRMRQFPWSVTYIRELWVTMDDGELNFEAIKSPSPYPGPKLPARRLNDEDFVELFIM